MRLVGAVSVLLTCVDSGRCAVVDSFIPQRPREKGLARTIWIKGLTVLKANKESTGSKKICFDTHKISKR